jgi:aspartate/methionine/tyrosine aminotransferase
VKYAVNPLVSAVNAPPIADVHNWLKDRRADVNVPLLDVAQAVPIDPPDVGLRRRIADLLVSDGLHRYTPITGLPELRDGLARYMNATHAVSAPAAGVSAADVVITAGCNQAFCAVMQALAGPGDEVILPLPFYFNHQMWLDMLGVTARHIPFAPDSGGLPTVDDFARLINHKTRALVVVSPNNPTGAVYAPALLEQLYDLARQAGIAMVLDETYQDFRPHLDSPPHTLFESGEWHGSFVQLFSFSKSYALTGYRLGSIVAGPGLVEALTKIQDCTNICAPRISQMMGKLALESEGAWLARQVRAMAARVTALRAAFAQPWYGFELVSAGAWFAYVRHPFSGRTATEVARHLAQAHGVLSVPGDMFGPGQDAYLRFAFANLQLDQIPELMSRLRAAAVE